MNTPSPLDLPLADIHRHLDGSLRPTTLIELAGRAGLAVPADLHFFPGMGLQEALSKFAFTLSVLQEPAAVARVASEMCEDAAEGDVTTLEIRFAPQLHGGAPIEAIVDAALEGAADRAGLILCGLYGEPLSMLERLVAVGAARPGVVGIDLAGGPLPSHDWGMADYAPAFRRAAELGLGTTVHAGEGRAPAEIRTAIELLGVDRIGHGTTLLDDPSVLDLVLERGITVEACPTSNHQVGVIPSVEAHPIARWLELGVKACVCCDNTLLSQVHAREELARVARIPDMSPELLTAAVGNGHDGAFARR
jgi:adenosine deaminase